jgi:uncharacterized protein YcgL (UPF0745 family)
MNLYCPLIHSQRGVEFCLYRCPSCKKAKCTEYLKNYNAISILEVDQIYLDKYGEPPVVIPLALRKRRKRRSKEELERARSTDG